MCLFGHAKQNNILIGKFSDWGPSTAATEALTTTATTSTSSGLSSSSRYALQIYDKGALCMLGSANTVGQIKERPKRATQVTDLTFFIALPRWSPCQPVLTFIIALPFSLFAVSGASLLCAQLRDSGGGGDGEVPLHHAGRLRHCPITTLTLVVTISPLS